MKNLAIIFGLVFVIIGILGFVPNPIVGMEGYFHTDTLHNIVHILLGLIILFSPNKSVVFRVVGIIYLILALLGFLGGDSILGIVAINGNDNWLHLVLGTILLLVGMKKEGREPLVV